MLEIERIQNVSLFEQTVYFPLLCLKKTVKIICWLFQKALDFFRVIYEFIKKMFSFSSRIATREVLSTEQQRATPRRHPPEPPSFQVREYQSLSSQGASLDPQTIGQLDRRAKNEKKLVRKILLNYASKISHKEKFKKLSQEASPEYFLLVSIVITRYLVFQGVKFVPDFIPDSKNADFLELYTEFDNLSRSDKKILSKQFFDESESYTDLSKLDAVAFEDLSRVKQFCKKLNTFSSRLLQGNPKFFSSLQQSIF